MSQFKISIPNDNHPIKSILFAIIAIDIAFNLKLNIINYNFEYNNDAYIEACKVTSDAANHTFMIYNKANQKACTACKIYNKTAAAAVAAAKKAAKNEYNITSVAEITAQNEYNIAYAAAYAAQNEYNIADAAAKVAQNEYNITSAAAKTATIAYVKIKANTASASAKKEEEDAKSKTKFAKAATAAEVSIDFTNAANAAYTAAYATVYPKNAANAAYFNIRNVHTNTEDIDIINYAEYAINNKSPDKDLFFAIGKLLQAYILLKNKKN